MNLLRGLKGEYHKKDPINSYIEIVKIMTCLSYKSTPSSSDIFDQPDGPDQDMPHAINVTPAEQEAIERVCIFFIIKIERVCILSVPENCCM